MFSEIRVTQMAAYLLLKNNGRMAYIKLLKLLYLAERQAMAQWGESISGDRFVSMPHGPVLSQTYDLIRCHNNNESFWQSLIKDEQNYEVSLQHLIDLDDLDELSQAECNILDEIMGQYNHMTPFELVDYTHDHCPEWEDPHGSSYPIRPEALFRAVAKTPEQAQKLTEKYREQQQLDQIRTQLL